MKPTGEFRSLVGEATLDKGDAFRQALVQGYAMLLGCSFGNVCEHMGVCQFARAISGGGKENG